MNSSILINESRRPVTVAPKAAAAAGQPEAVQVGIDILKSGGNAADAAVAMAAVMNLAQPMNTGLGGDVFCLFYDAKSKTVKGLNGSGRSPQALNLEKANADGFNDSVPFPLTHGHTVTVPGAAAAWCDIVTHFGSGSLKMSDILNPAITLAENGIPITQGSAFHWNKGMHFLLDSKYPHGKELTIDGRAPKWGEIWKNQSLANTFKAIAKDGKKGYYQGEIAQSIVEAVSNSGGVMSLEDLESHESTIVEPISVGYKGKRIWEIPPNGQGIVALMALNILKAFNVKDMGHNSAAYLHILIEALRLSFADGFQHIADQSKGKVPVENLLSESYARFKQSQINEKCAIKILPITEDVSNFGSDTVHLTVVDENGNACSFLNSNFKGFGTGIVPKGCGFSLQNRGRNFSLKEGHPNCIAPKKRSYHTIIPAIITDDKTGDLLCSYGVMGGFMQPQGHVQVLLNMLEFGMNPQEALDKPRFCCRVDLSPAMDIVCFEDGIEEHVLRKLQAMGHKVNGPLKNQDRAVFGRGHVITKGAWWLPEGREDTNREDNVLWAGSDPRTDGLALGY